MGQVLHGCATTTEAAAAAAHVNSLGRSIVTRSIKSQGRLAS